MEEIYDPERQKVFYGVGCYPTTTEEAILMGLQGKHHEEMRGMTIAAFRVAQNRTSIDDRLMSHDLLYFLLGSSDTAVAYWIREGRLSEGEGGYYLEPDGVKECVKSLNSENTRGFNASEEQVQEWVHRMLLGDGVATQRFIVTNQKVANNIQPDPETLRMINDRRGQPKFRVELLKLYGGRCVITNCETIEALEAAHISPYVEDRSYQLQNGLLLRADIHTLFDLFLISIDPNQRVVVSPDCLNSYGDLKGKQVSIPAEVLDNDEFRYALICHYDKWRQKSGC
ncbi:HNH endonuclease [Shewanella baltica]|uniref:HNH endonuclease n=1 Tax=Shewanella baltica TaxID=62322 RepID=UPI00217D887A|nr:HNH endonuclease [Shewanella baltica]MCS6177675.1 hypothetical protein [Shewanella baltica]MCS6253821.1 hypothetical protein [Shewanella baltica]